jgi:hypothetical protein
MNAAAHNRQPTAVSTHSAFEASAKARLFFRRDEACTLNIMRNGLANWVTAVLLMFQLVLGLQWQVAHADMDPAYAEASGVDARHCPDHPSHGLTNDERRVAGASTGAPSAHTNPVHGHDCCGSVDCQCHGAQSPAVLNLPLGGVVGLGSLLLPSFDARPPVARTNELFRPPIA